jgi:integrase
MSKLKEPKLCEDRGRFFIWLDGQRHYFSAKDKREAEVKRKQFLANLWLGNPGAPSGTDGSSPPGRIVPCNPPSDTGDVLIAELCADYLNERRGKVSPTQLDNERRIIALLVSLYGKTGAAAFDINCLRVVRNEFIQRGFVRQKINWRVRRIQFMFRWGASYKIVPASVYQELKTLIPIKKGEYDLPESRERQTISLADIEKTLAELSPVLRAMVIVHLAVAGRPTAICTMRIENIDRQAEDLWAITVQDKMDYLEDSEAKILYLAKTEIDVVLPLIGDRTEGYIFRPIDAIGYDKQRRANGAANMKKQPSRAARDAERSNNPKLNVGECYDFTAYRKAVYRACDRAGVARWFPYQLRHTGVTLIGLEHGIEAAQHTAGHKDIKTTLRYFHGENEIAKRVALSRNKPATAKKQSPSQDAVISELLQQNQQLLERLLQKNE